MVNKNNDFKIGDIVETILQETEFLPIEFANDFDFRGLISIPEKTTMIIIDIIVMEYTHYILFADNRKFIAPRDIKNAHEVFRKINYD